MMTNGTAKDRQSEVQLEIQQLLSGLDKLRRANQKLTDKRIDDENQLVRTIAKEMGPEADVERILSRNREATTKDDALEERLGAVNNIIAKFEARMKSFVESAAPDVIAVIEQNLKEKKDAAAQQEQVSDALQKEIEDLEKQLEEMKSGRKTKGKY